MKAQVSGSAETVELMSWKRMIPRDKPQSYRVTNECRNRGSRLATGSGFGPSNVMIGLVLRGSCIESPGHIE